MRALLPGSALAAAVLLSACGVAAAGETEPGDVDAKALVRIASPPLGLPPVPLPADNPPREARIALGRKLFFDRRLSGNGTMSCGMCHVPEQGFTNNELATPIGVAGRSLRRNAPTLLNVAYVRQPFLDGRETSLETQVISPLVAHNEMANPSIGHLIAKLAALPDYEGLFERAFGEGPSIGNLGRAIASWERTLLAGESAFDRWRFGGEDDALTAQQKRGFRLFTGRAGCARCHPVGERHALFTDHAFHDTGVGHPDALSDEPVPVEIEPGRRVMMSRSAVEAVGEPRRIDRGRYEVTLQTDDLWKFRTPSLRNVALTAPYMHDGSLRTLADVVRFYARGGVPHEGLDPLLQPLELSDDDVAALVAFLESLTGKGVDALIRDARSVAVGN